VQAETGGAGVSADRSDPSIDTGSGGPLPQRPTHVIWDWNGTLLDDVGAVLQATTVAFRQAGIHVEVTGETYRRSFTRPIHLFYERLLGRPIGREEWMRLDHAFHLEFTRLEDRCTLAAGAREVLGEVRALGWTQSVCSMLPEEYLLPAVARQGIAGHFVRVDGLRGAERGGAKLENLIAHLGLLGVAPSGTVMVGDTVDDALAARGAGIACILLDSGAGLHDSATIRGAGVPVAAGVPEALALLRPGAAPPRP
jgi:phosphoglycolate phosphatase-like HAD superfamily hydrolase